MGEVRSPLQGTVVTVAEAGDTVHATTTVVVIESMKMEHSVEAGVEGTIAEVLVVVGQQVAAGDVLARVEPGTVEAIVATKAVAETGAGLRADLAEVLDRHAVGMDEGGGAEDDHEAGEGEDQFEMTEDGFHGSRRGADEGDCRLFLRTR